MRKGFTLIECIVAMVLMSISMITMCTLLSKSMASIDDFANIIGDDRQIQQVKDYVQSDVAKIDKSQINNLYFLNSSSIDLKELGSYNVAYRVRDGELVRMELDAGTSSVINTKNLMAITSGSFSSQGSELLITVSNRFGKNQLGFYCE